MSTPRFGKHDREVSKSQGKSWPKAPKAATGHLLNLREIEERFAVSEYWVYRWADEGLLHAVPDGKYLHYPDWEVAELAAELRLGPVPTHDGPGGKSKMGWTEAA